MQRSLMAVLGIAALAGCSEGTGPGGNPSPLDPGTVSLTLVTGPAGGPLFSRAGIADDTIVSGTDTLIITRAQLVLREIEVELEDDDACDDDDSSSTGDDDSCEEFSTGAILVDLPLNGQAETQLTIAVPPGIYDEIEFELHKPEDDGDDDAFLAEHPDFDGVSIRVEGTFNGAPFVFESDINVEQEIDLNPPLEVTDSTGTNVTLRVDISGWFRTGTGGVVNPGTANHNGVNEDLVKDNIEASFHAFEDDDCDGHDDSDDD
jgi:hypothetical protein